MATVNVTKNVTLNLAEDEAEMLFNLLSFVVLGKAGRATLAYNVLDALEAAGIESDDYDTIKVYEEEGLPTIKFTDV